MPVTAQAPGAAQVTAAFASALGMPSADTGYADALAGRDTPQARSHITELAAIIDVPGMLDLLRTVKDGFENPLYEPLIDGIVEDAQAQALAEPWLEAADVLLFKLRMTEPEPEPPTSFPELAARLPDGEADRYRELLDRALRHDLRRGLSHLRGESDISDWLVLCGVQAALCAVIVERVQGSCGEDFVAANLATGDLYLHLRRQADDAGLPNLHSLLTDSGEIVEAVRGLLPTGPGNYTISDDAEDEFRFGLEMAIAGAITRGRVATDSQS